jgi:hypothetical protein
MIRKCVLHEFSLEITCYRAEEPLNLKKAFCLFLCFVFKVEMKKRTTNHFRELVRLDIITRMVTPNLDHSIIIV